MLLAKTECFFMHKIMQYLENEENLAERLWDSFGLDEIAWIIKVGIIQNMNIYEEQTRFK